MLFAYLRGRMVESATRDAVERSSSREEPSKIDWRAAFRDGSGGPLLLQPSPAASKRPGKPWHDYIRRHDNCCVPLSDRACGPKGGRRVQGGLGRSVCL